MINKVASDLQAQVDRRNRYIDELLARINTIEEEKDREFKN
jgi:transcription elongation GreA/GreB family factor